MTMVIVVCEGRTEAAFVREILQPRLAHDGIDDGPDTHPSVRLRQLRPKYKKVAHGVAVASCIGLHRIRSECRHFNDWLTRIEALPALASCA